MASSITNSNAILEHLDEGKSYEVDFGETWNSTNESKYAYHTIKYDFKPASVLKSEQAELHVGSMKDVSIIIPNVEGSSTPSTKFSGNTKPYSAKECLMIIDPKTGEIVLERLSANVRVKNVRSNNPSIKLANPRPSNSNEISTDKKTTKSVTTTNMNVKMIAPSASSGTSTLKSTNISSRTSIHSSTKTTSQKPTTSPMNDRLSDDESSPDLSNVNASNTVSVLPATTISRRSSRASLERDLRLSDTSDDEA